MTLYQDSYRERRLARPWESHPLYSGDPTSLIDDNGEPVPLNPTWQYWFIRRSYDEASAKALSEDDRDRAFANIPSIVRAPGFKARHRFDAEGWLRTTYLWLKGHSQNELADIGQVSPSNISHSIARFGKVISKQRTLEQVISWAPPVQSGAVIETEVQSRLQRARRFLAASYSSDLGVMLPDEVVSILTDFAQTLNSETDSQMNQRVNRLSRWLSGETIDQIAGDMGMSRRAIRDSISTEGSRLAQVFPEAMLTDFVERIKRGEAIPSELGRIAIQPKIEQTSLIENSSGEVDLDQIGAELEVRLPKRPKRKKSSDKSKGVAAERPKKPKYHSVMTSEEFWKSPIRPPRYSGISRINKWSRGKTSLPEVERVEHEVIDGKVYKVTVLKGYNGRAPLPDGQKMINDESLQ